MSAQSYTNRRRVIAEAALTKIEYPGNAVATNNSMHASINCGILDFQEIDYNSRTYNSPATIFLLDTFATPNNGLFIKQRGLPKPIPRIAVKSPLQKPPPTLPLPLKKETKDIVKKNTSNHLIKASKTIPNIVFTYTSNKPPVLLPKQSSIPIIINPTFRKLSIQTVPRPLDTKKPIQNVLLAPQLQNKVFYSNTTPTNKKKPTAGPNISSSKRPTAIIDIKPSTHTSKSKVTHTIVKDSPSVTYNLPSLSKSSKDGQTQQHGIVLSNSISNTTFNIHPTANPTQKNKRPQNTIDATKLSNVSFNSPGLIFHQNNSTMRPYFIINNVDVKFTLPNDRYFVLYGGDAETVFADDQYMRSSMVYDGGYA
jgi:hypothetical protein